VAEKTRKAKQKSAPDSGQTPEQPQIRSFETEVQQILHLMIHSLYSHKEIFLRELISNASDACDKLRFASLTDAGLLENGGDLEIRVDYDKKLRTITVSDNGIGMDFDEVADNIGTIARSGTKQFAAALSGDQSHDARLIGQFGVGFYSVFMVAEQVTLTTRKAGAVTGDGVRWTSDGSGKYTIERIDRPERGTTVVLKLRKEESEYVDPHRLRTIIKKYSDHISLPIRMPKLGSSDSGAEDWETVNKGAALWARNKKDITREEYDNFYTTLSYDSEPPLSVLHNRVEGKLEYITLFYIPSRAQFDLWDREHRHGVKLYVRRVFIADDTEHLMPAYLRFVRGVVDSADLPLNVSREFLQHNKQIDKIKAASVKKILAEFQRLAEKESDAYLKFWQQFGQVLKEGIIEDPDNRDVVAGLLRFNSTRTAGPDEFVSLDAYIERMPEHQKDIYYLTGESYAAVKDSPHLEIFRKHGIEVLLLSDPIDEWLVAHLTEYKGKALQSIAKGALDLDEIAKEDRGADKEKSAQEKRYGDLLARLKELLGSRVKDVRLSDRLTDSPACLVADEHDIGANMERIMKAIGQKVPQYMPILEINPNHPVISALKPDTVDLEDWALVLFDQAALSEGAHLREPAAYVRRINKLLGNALGEGTSSIILTR